MKHSLAFSYLSLALLCACSEVDTRTQLTFSIAVSEALAQQTETLSVLVRSDARGDQTQEFAKSELTWPVEIVVLPVQGQDSNYEVTLTATAYGAGRTRLGTHTVNGRFAAGKLRVVQVPLGPGAPMPDAGNEDGGETKPDSGKPDAKTDENDAGGDTRTDAGGTTDPVPQDAGSGVVNCATPGNGIQCDDGNPCNGSERCEPANGGANNSGCVPGMDVVTCGADATCDRSTGQCSTCLVKPDGDGDGVNSVACMGLDCNDGDDKVAPGKDELCDGKDNDCDGTVDGAKANPSCASTAPTGGTASCVSGRCTPACTNPNFQVENGACVAPPVTCMLSCAPGACMIKDNVPFCSCPSGYQAGLSMRRCAPIGENREIGFETTCDNMPTPGAFVAESKMLPATLFAACGVSSITSGAMMAAPQLVQPIATPVVGITQDVALGSPVSAAGEPVTIALAFLPAVNEVRFDVLDLDNPAGLSVIVRAGGVDLPAVALAAPANSKQVAFSRMATTPIEQITLTYTPLAGAMADAFYVDALSYKVTGCGDKAVDAAASESCDDGNAVQCDGCDNACAPSPTPCTEPV